MNATNIEIRKLWISHRNKSYGLRISNRDAKIIKMVKKATKSGITSETLVKKYEITPQAATSVLRALCDKGYLWREKLGSSTRGYKFVYRLNNELYLT